MNSFVVDKVIFPRTQLVDENGKYYNSISVKDALYMSSKAGLNLVCIKKCNAQEGLPLCKIINFGKWKYSQEKLLKKEKVHKSTKTIRFSYVISDYDIGHKIKQINKLLDHGDDVILEMKLAKKEKRFLKEGIDKINNIVKMCLEKGKIVSEKENDGQISIKITKK